VLKTLSWGPSHGYGIARWIRERSGETFRVLDGALYTSLHRLGAWRCRFRVGPRGEREAREVLSSDDRRAPRAADRDLGVGALCGRHGRCPFRNSANQLTPEA